MPRPKPIRASFDGDASTDIALANEPGVTEHPVNAMTGAITFTILDVWPGTSCGGREPSDDALISDIGVFVADG